MSMFIVFEGIDGSGTSTQAALLHSALISRHERATLTSEPTSGPIGHLIRQINTRRTHVSDQQSVVDTALAYLFAADRFDHLHNDVDGILGRLRDGYTVISTRYYLSSFAYNAHSEADFALVSTLNARFPQPDLTFYLDCPLEESLRRIQRQGRGPDRQETAENLKRVSSNYERALAAYNGRLVRCDATLPPARVHELVMHAVANAVATARKEP